MKDRIVSILSALHANLKRLEAGADGDQNSWCDIDSAGFFPMDKGVVRRLHEDETLRDFTFLLADDKQLKINSFLAAMLSEAVQVKLSTLVGSEGPRMTYNLTDVPFSLLETLISLALSDKFRVQQSEILDLIFLANELRFPKQLRAGLDVEMQRLLGLEASSIEAEMESIHRDNRDIAIRTAWNVQPIERLPALYGFEDRIFQSIAGLTLGHYYGIWDGRAYRLNVFCGVNHYADNSVYVREPIHRHLTLSSFTGLHPMVSFDHVRPKTAYPTGNQLLNRRLSDIPDDLRDEQIGTFFEINMDPSIRVFDKVLLLGFNNRARAYVLHQGQIYLRYTADLRIMVLRTRRAAVSSDDMAAVSSEEDKIRAWVIVSSGPPPDRSNIGSTPVQADSALVVGSYYGSRYDLLADIYNTATVCVLYLGAEPSPPQMVYVFLDGVILTVEKTRLFFMNGDGGGNAL